MCLECYDYYPIVMREVSSVCCDMFFSIMEMLNVGIKCAVNCNA